MDNILLKIFPYTDNQSLLQYDSEGLWSITLPNDADVISQIILNELEIPVGNGIILDAMAGLGGNTISFAKYFKKIIAIELNVERFQLLKSNVLAYSYDNIEMINGDCMKHLNIETEEVIGYFFDPPWGGPDYKNMNKTKLKIGSTNLSDLINKLKEKDNKIFLKLPGNYDIDEFNTYNFKIIKIKNYLLLIF